MQELAENEVLFLPKGKLSTWIFEREQIWQKKLVGAEELAEFSRKRGLSVTPNDVIALWNLGLLKADLVVSVHPLTQEGLVELGRDNQSQYCYSDESRDLKSLGDNFLTISSLPEGIKLKFHIFRYYVLYNLLKRITFKDVLAKFIYPGNDYKSYEHRKHLFEEYYSSPQCKTDIEYWESVAALIIATEPRAYSHLFNVFRWYNFATEEEQRKLIDQHWTELSDYYKTIGQTSLEIYRKNICFDTQNIEPNTNLQNIIRMIRSEERLKLEGHIGGAVLLRTMAEILRRATEEVFDVRLPEEDTFGYGHTFLDTRLELYGDERLFDGDRKVALAFMRQHSLDYSLRLRWYVEGSTEWAALSNFFGKNSFSGVELVNLRGRVGNKDGLTFRDSLREDIKNQIFSLVSIDGDVSDNLRVVSKAASDDEIFGGFFIANPDFEFANFTIEELATIIEKLALDNGIPKEDLTTLRQDISSAKSGAELLKKLPSSVKPFVGKGEKWGEYLMEYALEHPELGDSGQRPLIEALDMAYRVTVAHQNVAYAFNRKRFRVNPKTGKMVER